MEIKPGFYQHFKGHNVRVFFVAKHTETEEDYVVYEHIGPNEKSKYWVRPVNMFLENVQRDGYSGPRFKYMGDEL
jgi:hypothetical protein